MYDADECRIKGNDIYREIQSNGFSEAFPTAAKLAEAEKFYSWQRNACCTSDNRAMAYKNLGSLSFLWARWLSSNAPTATLPQEDLLTKCKGRLAEAATNYSKAWTEGKGKPPEWLHKLEDLIIQLIDWATENEQAPSDSADPSSAFSLLQSVCKAMDKPNPQTIVSGYAYGRHFDLLFSRGVEILKKPGDDDGVVKGLTWMRESMLPLEKLLMLPEEFDKTGNIVATARQWQGEIQKHLDLVVLEPPKNIPPVDVTRTPIQDELKETLDSLKSEAAQSTESFLRFIYNNHRRPNSDFKLGNLSNPYETKVAIQDARHYYHPDRNSGKEPKWCFICQAITTYLNIRYQIYKDFKLSP